MTSSTAKRQRQQAAGFTLLTVIAALTIFVIVAILAYILIRGVRAISPGFLFTPPSKHPWRQFQGPMWMKKNCWIASNAVWKN